MYPARPVARWQPGGECSTEVHMSNFRVFEDPFRALPWVGGGLLLLALGVGFVIGRC